MLELHAELRALALGAAGGRWPVRSVMHYVDVGCYVALVELNLTRAHITVLRFGVP